MFDYLDAIIELERVVKHAQWIVWFRRDSGLKAFFGKE